MSGDFQGGVFALITLATFALFAFWGMVTGAALHVVGAAGARREGRRRPTLLAFLGRGVGGAAVVLALGLAVVRGSWPGDRPVIAVLVGAVAGALSHRSVR